MRSRKNKIFLGLFTLLLNGCIVTTSGDATWELYVGVRTRQISKEPSKINFQSNQIDKIISSFMNEPSFGKDGNIIPKTLLYAAKWYFGVPTLLHAF